MKLKRVKKKVLLVSWSHVDLAFRKFIEDELGDDFLFFRFSHHHEWNTFNRSIIKNFLHIVKQLLVIIRLSRNSDIILFGTNLCRILFPALALNRVYYIYNELPSVRFGLLMLYDQLIFLLVKKIYLSSDSRKDLIENYRFNVKRVGVIDNITFDIIESNISIKTTVTTKKAILIGTLDETRFGVDTVKSLNYIMSKGVFVDILPSNIKRGLNTSHHGIKFLDPVPHNEVADLLRKYDYGILAYEPISLNNDYAAPLKLYEYINAGLTVICLFPNKGIESIRLIYPSLFSDISLKNDFSVNQFTEERRSFLESALYRNKQFALEVISAIRNLD